MRADGRSERTLTYRLSSAYDCWGHRRTLRTARRHGLWHLGVEDFDMPSDAASPDDDGRAGDDERRREALRIFEASGRFTPAEIRTMRALALESLTIDEVARAEGVSRQAIRARIIGNSRGQGGLLKKALDVQRPTSQPPLTVNGDRDLRDPAVRDVVTP
jgi:hypothetical protein